MMLIDPDRISRDLETIAGFNDSTPDVGFSRPTFSPAWRQARDYVISQAKDAGCKVRIDAAGNVHARHESIAWDEKVWLSGSHIDSVPTGGKFDGVIGVVCPLELLRAAHWAKNAIPLELIIFAEEEGTTFGLGMIGSRLWTRSMTPDAIKPFKNRHGEDFFQAGKNDGVRPADLATDALRSDVYLGLVELHIEQGPVLWGDGKPLAVVTAIAGRRQFRATFGSKPNHAGSTPMSHRKDALVAAARVIIGIEAMAKEIGNGVVATVGSIQCQPNAINVIPGNVQITADIRSPDQENLDLCADRLESMVKDCGLDEVGFFITEDQPPIVMDSAICNALCRANDNRQNRAVSGALHDAAIVAPHLPTAMLFVASRDGTSHNPAEFSRIEDILAATRVLAKLVGS